MSAQMSPQINNESNSITDPEFDESSTIDEEHETREVVVTELQSGLRLDRVLTQSIAEFSRSYLQDLIANALVKVNGAVQTKISKAVRLGDVLQVELRPTDQSQAYVAEDIAIDIVYQDDYLLVVNKPAGLVVHPAPGNWRGTLLNALLFHFPQSQLVPRTGIVHRLDKDTSGLMVVAKTRSCMDALVKLIAAREVTREYVALAHRPLRLNESPSFADRIINQSIGRDPRNRLKMAAFEPGSLNAKAARTDIHVLQKMENYLWVQCKLHTGRTHQIRVHMAYIGYPLVADLIYGGKKALGLERQALHAKRLAFHHPVTLEWLEFLSPIPIDLETALNRANEIS